MTHSFWRKHPSKKLTATLLLLAVLVMVFVYRSPIVIKGIEHFTKPHNVYVSCLDFSFDWQLDLNIKQACISSPMGSIELREVIWQPWSNALSIEQLNVKHIKQLVIDKIVDEGFSIDEVSSKELNLPTSLPTLSISSINIESYALLQPIHLVVSPLSNNTLSITGDVNASINMSPGSPNSIVANIQWRLSELIKWLPQTQQTFQDNAELLEGLALDASKIKTRLIFDGKTLRADSLLDINSRIHVSKCPINVIINGNLLVNVDMSNLHTSLDLSQLTSGVSVENCPLLEDYFAADDLPQLSFVLPQKITIDETHLSLPQLQVIDKRNAHRSIVLNALNYTTTGELDLNYHISIKQPIKTKQIAVGMAEFQARGNVSVDLSILNTQQAINFKITDASSQLIINDLQMDSLHIGKLTSNVTLSGASLDYLQLSIDNQLSQLLHPDFSAQNITNHIDVNILEFKHLSFSGDSIVTHLSAQNLNFMPIEMQHTGQASFANMANMAVSSQHNISLEDDFLIELTQQHTTAKVHINQQDITGLQSIISQLENTLQVIEGNLSASIEFTLPEEGEQFITQGKAEFQQVSAKYQDYILKNMTYQTPLMFDSAGLQLTESILHLDSVDVGVMIERLTANVIAQNSVLRLKQVQGEIFNGQFSFGNLWLDGREQQFNCHVKNIDLAQIMALQQQPGIHITGNIDGDMPLFIGKQGISIENGWLASIAGGKLTIIDNQSFDAIKVQQPQLALLENLDFSHLQSNVRFTPDGWVFFDLALQGNNPDKKQAVNFNYSHQENIFSLLESIRLVKAIENKIEQKITQGGKK